MIEISAAKAAAKELAEGQSRTSLTREIKKRFLLSDWAIEELQRQYEKSLRLPKKVTAAGFYRKYIVYNADGTGVDFNAEYFVLRLDGGGTDRVHIEACRKAAEAYAAAVDGTHLSEVGAELLALIEVLKGGES